MIEQRAKAQSWSSSLLSMSKWNRRIFTGGLQSERPGADNVRMPRFNRNIFNIFNIVLNRREVHNMKDTGKCQFQLDIEDAISKGLVYK